MNQIPDAWGNARAQVAGPLEGLRVLEFVGMGPAPFAAMMMADMGASVLRVDREQGPSDHYDVLARNRAGTVTLDLKSAEGQAEAIRLAASADVLVEGFRPGVMERLGLGPSELSEINPGLVYGRVTGWGQDGPLATTAGHDINYIAVTGALDSIRRPGATPLPPLNLVGDYGGGGMFVLAGVLAALVERARTGEGVVVDASMVDGTALLLSSIWTARANRTWNETPGTNRIDGGAPFYDTYRTSDDKFMAVGCIEPRFYQKLLSGLGLDPRSLPEQHEQQRWPELKRVIADRFAERTRDHWVDVFDGTDACVTPVMSLSESYDHPQVRARETLYTSDCGKGPFFEPAAAPRFVRTVAQRQCIDPSGMVTDEQR